MIKERKWKKMIIYIVSFVIVLSLSITLFINLNPAFGGNLTKEQKESYKKLNNYVNDKFINYAAEGLDTNSKLSFQNIQNNNQYSKGDRSPSNEIPVLKINWDKIKSKQDSLTWLGHSAFLISIDNKKILLDPMLSPVASPVSFIGVKRYKYSENMLNIIDDMPPIDAVFISHNHYDHLDYQSIVKLKNKVSHFYIPLGVSADLIRWGVAKEKITELNWWQEAKYENLNIAFTPSRHFSGRSILDYDKTLWGGWVIAGTNIKLYTSGDGGYGPHFKEIGTKYGPFDIALIEGAQYDKRWSNVHMLPEQAVQASIDVNSKNMMLMHWGAFTLANHGWKEPIERALKESNKDGVNTISPQIGETVPLNSEMQQPSSLWWYY